MADAILALSCYQRDLREMMHTTIFLSEVEERTALSSWFLLSSLSFHLFSLSLLKEEVSIVSG